MSNHFELLINLLSNSYDFEGLIFMKDFFVRKRSYNIEGLIIHERFFFLEKDLHHTVLNFKKVHYCY